MKEHVMKAYPCRPAGVRTLRWAGLGLLAAAGLVLSGCFALADTQDMRLGINETKLDVQRLQTDLKESVMRLEYRLDQIDSKLAAQQEIDKIFNQQVQDDLTQIRAALPPRAEARRPKPPVETTVEAEPVARPSRPVPADAGEPFAPEPTSAEPALVEEPSVVETAPSGEPARPQEMPSPVETVVSPEAPLSAETAQPADPVIVARVTPAPEEAPTGEGAARAATVPDDEGAADLLAARDAYSRKDLAKCVEIYEKWLAQRPASSRAPEVLFNLGRCRFDMGEFDLARETFDRIVRDYPASGIISQSLHSRALCEMRLSQWPTALQTLEILRLMYPDYEPKKIDNLRESVRSRMQ